MNTVDNSACPIFTLPAEVLVNIFERVPDPALALVCRRFREVVNDDKIKRILLENILRVFSYENFLDWGIVNYSSLPVDQKVKVAYASFLDLTRRRNPTQYIGKSQAIIFNYTYFKLAAYDHQMAEYLSLLTFCQQFIPGTVLIDNIINSKLSIEDKRKLIGTKLERIVAPATLAINFSFRSLAEIPKEISLFTRLTSLDISNNLLRFLPREIGNFPDLSTFYAPNNFLEFLPETVWNLPALVNFNVSNNPIRIISENIGNLRTLITLDLSYLRIEVLPMSIGNLSQLTHLHLHHNAFLREIPEMIQPPTSLRVLDLHACTSLQNLPLWIGNLNRLEVLLLHNTPIREFPELRSPELRLISFPQNASRLPAGMNATNFPNLHTIKIYKCQAASIGRPMKRMFPYIKVKFIDKESKPIRQRVNDFFRGR